MSSALQRNYLSDYAPYPVVVEQVDLAFILEPARTRVHATLSLQVKEDISLPCALPLKGEELTLVKLRLNGQLLAPEAYVLDGEGLTLMLSERRSLLEVVTDIHPDQNHRLEGLYVSGGVFCTQCEAEGFRRITYFPDRPDVLARYRVRIEAHKEQVPVLLSNGNCTEQGDMADGWHYAVWEDPHPKPCYLFALVAGDLVCRQAPFVTAQGRKVSLEVYVRAHHADRCDHALTSLANAMRWDEQAFGRCYDLDRYMIVAVDDFNMGAMENKGLNVFNARFVLADPATATDVDYTNIDSVIAHEYFHNWTGNRVTCRDWFQLTLKEGLTVLRDQLYTEQTLLGKVKRIEDVRLLRSVQFSEDAGPMRHPVQPDSYAEMNNFYTATVYEKGAEVVRIYRTLLGEDGFRKGMDLYFDRHDGQAVTVHDFRRAMADANGCDLEQMHAWYTQAGTPHLEIHIDWDATTGRLYLKLRQWQPQLGLSFQPLLMPVSLALFDQQGQRQSASLVQGQGRWSGSEGVLWFSELESQFVFEGLGDAPRVSVLRDFSAPVVLSVSRQLTDWLWQAEHDDDLFNRWEGWQQAWLAVLVQGVADVRQGRAFVLPESMLALTRAAIKDESLPPGWLVEALRLPGFDYLAQQLDGLWVDEMREVLRASRRTLGSLLAEDWWRLLSRLDMTGEYVFSAQAMGQRALRNHALMLLCEAGDVRAHELAWAQVQAGHNMTDVQAALTALVHAGAAQSADALALFYQRWQSVPLVVDKWFSVQASSPLASAQEVDALCLHQAFSWTNPNRVRSVLGVMGRANPGAFHQADGEGYRRLAQRVLEVDAINPQVSARLVQAFSPWRRLPAERQQLAGEALALIEQQARLSRDVREVLEHLRANG